MWDGDKLGFLRHPVPFFLKREWKRLKRLVWKQGVFTFGQANVSSPERKGAEPRREPVVPEEGKRTGGDVASSGRLG